MTTQPASAPVVSADRLDVVRDLPQQRKAPRPGPADAVSHFRLEDMQRGWFVGDFAPAALRTSSVEVAVKHLHRGDVEMLHEHRVATEVTVVISGKVRIGNVTWHSGDIIVLPPTTPAACEVLTDSLIVVVKTPSVAGDKYVDPA